MIGCDQDVVCIWVGDQRLHARPDTAVLAKAYPMIPIRFGVLCNPWHCPNLVRLLFVNLNRWSRDPDEPACSPFPTYRPRLKVFKVA
jgi:hypothetical protein